MISMIFNKRIRDRSGQVTPITGWLLGYFDVFTLCLHCSQSLACLVYSATLFPVQFAMSSSHVLFGLSLPWFSFTIPCITVYARIPSLHVVCPNHCSFLHCATSSKGSYSPIIAFTPCCTSIFETLCFHVIPSILLKHLNSKACNLFNCFVICPNLTSRGQ